METETDMRYVVKLKYPEDYPITRPLSVEFENPETLMKDSYTDHGEDLLQGFEIDEDKNLVLPEGTVVKRIMTDFGRTILLEGEDYDLLPLGF